VVHVCLYEFEGLFLDHAHCLRVEHSFEILDEFAADSLTLLAGLVEGVSDNLLHVVEALDSLAHTQAEVAEPLVVKCDCPVFAQELNRVRDNVVLVALSELIEVILVETNETPETLQDDFLVTHVGDRVDQADAVESELYEVSLARASVQVVTDEVDSVLSFLLARLQDQWVRRLDVVVDDVVGENASLTLWKEEKRELFVKLTFTWRRLMRVMDIKNASSEARSHLTAVVAIHAEGAALTQSLVSVGELAKTACRKDGWVGRLEVSVHNQSTVVNEAVVVNALKDIRVNVAMTAGD